MQTRIHRHARAMLVVFIACACERPDAPLLITADVEPAAVLLGDSTQVIVTVLNRSAKPQMIAGGVCGFDFVIKTLDGTVVGPNTFSCSAD